MRYKRKIKETGKWQDKRGLSGGLQAWNVKDNHISIKNQKRIGFE